MRTSARVQSPRCRRHQVSQTIQRCGAPVNLYTSTALLDAHNRARTESILAGEDLSDLHDALVALGGGDLEAEDVVAAGETVGNAAVQAVHVLDHLGLDAEGGALAGGVEEDAEGAGAVAVVHGPGDLLGRAGLERSHGVAGDGHTLTAAVGSDTDVLKRGGVGETRRGDETAVGADRSGQGQDGEDGGQGLHLVYA